jgi:bacterioferritin-associated ferredoxin
VIGLAAATVLLKAQGTLPGRRVVVAGCGPLLAAVAAKIVAHGGEVAAVVDLASRGEWLKALRGFATQPKLLARGASWALKLFGRRIPVHFASTVLRAEGAERVERIMIGRVAEDGRRTGHEEQTIDRIDALVIGHGLVPASELTRLLGAAHVYDRLRGGWTPVRDECERTSVAGLYACGDGSGIRGALPAVAAGRLAGLAVAHDAGALGVARFAAETSPLRASLKGLEPFSRAAAGLMALRPAMVADIAASTVVCRCEDVTHGEIEAAFDAGAADLSQLKHFTRCGMGPCQGRMCGDIVGELAAARFGSREAAGCWTARPPLFPVPLNELLGCYSYSDIPIPNPAPL